MVDVNCMTHTLLHDHTRVDEAGDEFRADVLERISPYHKGSVAETPIHNQHKSSPQLVVV